MTYKQALSQFNRAAGQLKRYYDIDPEEFIQGAKTPAQIQKALGRMKFEAEQQAIEKRIEEYEKKFEAEKEKREAAARFEIENIKSSFENYVNACRKSTAREDAQLSLNMINSIIDESVEKYGAETAVEWLRPWGHVLARKIERLILAIYDDYYNTNDRWYIVDSDGEIGRQRYKEDLEYFAFIMGVTCPPIVFI